MTEKEINLSDEYKICDDHKTVKCISHIENLGYDKKFLQSIKKAGYHFYINKKKIW